MELAKTNTKMRIKMHMDMGVRMSARLSLPKSERSKATSAGICGAVPCSRPATPAILGTQPCAVATRAEDAICSTLGEVDGVWRSVRRGGVKRKRWRG